MRCSKGQGELFENVNLLHSIAESENQMPMSSEFIKRWQKQIQDHQLNLFMKNKQSNKQTSLFQKDHHSSIEHFEPLKLTPLPLNFWRWPKCPHNGPAIYLVMDKTSNSNKHLLLYIGETVSADKRWKGEHDCKNYLSSYCEYLQKAGIKSQLSIRFWLDVPKETKARRKLEQNLIQYWLPPFNKETRARWSTPFTYELNQ